MNLASMWICKCQPNGARRSPKATTSSIEAACFRLQNLFRPNQAPVVNVVAAVLVLTSAIPIYFAQRLSGDTVNATAAP